MCTAKTVRRPFRSLPDYHQNHEAPISQGFFLSRPLLNFSLASKYDEYMTESLEIAELLIAISRMPEDRRVRSSKTWYESQKEHWVGWLFHYNSPGAYGRKVTKGRDAKYVYNHIVCPGLLLYLVKGSGVDERAIKAAKKAAALEKTDMAKAGAIRRHIPWIAVLEALRRSGHLSEYAS